MARRTRVKQDVDEVFTDLSGHSETPAGLVEASDLERDLETELHETADQRKRRLDSEAELEVVAEEQDDDEQDDETGDQDTQEIVETTEPGEIIFDPKDVELILAKDAALTARETNAKNAQARAKSDIEAAEAELEAALEAGDTKANVKANSKMQVARVAEATAGQDLAGIADERNALKGQAAKVMANAPKNEQGQPIITDVVRASRKVEPKGSKLFPDFLKHNAWFNDPRHATSRGILLSLDKDIAAEKKLDKDTPEYWAELGKRFNRVKPGVFKTPAGKPVASGARERSAGAPIPGGGGGGGRESPSNVRDIRLTNGDLDQMRFFGMDPANMDARRQWLSTKRELAADELRKAG